ncbi:riboflavin biosynthesis protein [Bryobacterales bacterium F-183]|nr:riboflavin biosynthesis protein [Bryobacterales bacterium F-183]
MPFRAIRDGQAVPADFGPCALTIGNFDGVHAGHRELMRRVAAAAGPHKLRPTVLTFDPHPAKIVAPARSPRLITTIEERLSLIQAEHMEQALVLPFTLDIARLRPEEFVRQLLVDTLQARYVVVGDNFRFGMDQAGDAAMLAKLGEQYGFRVEAVPAVKLGGVVVSSSEIRKRIGSGVDIGVANEMLERPYALAGRVVSGHGIGAKQTVPTLNLETAAEVLPGIGVYVTRTSDLDDRRRVWESVTNVGRRPTFHADGSDGLTIETFLLSEFDGVNPLRIRVEFLKWVREERKFPSPEALKQQIFRDVNEAKSFFTAAILEGNPLTGEL